MRVVVDTNVLFSALYDPRSVPGRLVELALEGAVEMHAPESVRVELDRVLRGKLGYTEDEWAATLQALPVAWIEEAIYGSRLDEAREAIEDPDDAPLVALALLLDAAVVSGDGDFHPLDDPVVETYRPRDTVDELGGR